jgi:thiamine biosynthesis lipoprotein
MPIAELLPVLPGTAQWPVWGTTARLVVTDPRHLPAARRLVTEHLAAVDLAASRFRADSEVCRLAGPTRVSPLLADLVRAALDAARRTDGDVDPTLGAALRGLGYDCDLALVRSGRAVEVRHRPAVGWQRVRLDGDLLTVPDGVLLDLGATAKAAAADACAELVAAACGTGVLVSLGGDVATAGAAPDWQILVQDGVDEPWTTVGLPAGSALATSSTISRRWRAGGRGLHHVLDPRTCQPAPRYWRTVSVAAHRCVDANTLTTAAVVRGRGALPWLRDLGAPARLVDAAGRVTTVGAWPA